MKHYKSYQSLIPLILFALLAPDGASGGGSSPSTPSGNPATPAPNAPPGPATSSPPSGAGRVGAPVEPPKAVGTAPTVSLGMVHNTPNAPGVAPIKKPDSANEGDGKGDGTPQDHLGAPGQGGDARTETKDERVAQHQSEPADPAERARIQQEKLKTYVP